jgi:hypothetical protein
MLNKLLFIFILALSVLFPTTNIFADTIVLKSGVTLEGKIIERTAYEITVEMQDGQQIPYMMADVESIQGQRVANADSQSNNPGEVSNSPQPGTINIPINPLMELNGMSRDDIFALRQKYIHQIPSLAPANYQPNMDVFGQIQDGKPWWGVLGFYYYGPGQESIEGPSYYSQFIANPYLLVGITTQAYYVKDSSIVPKDLTPMPTKLIWEKNGTWGQVIYNISDFNQEAQSDHFSSSEILNLELINARDFGFKFFSIDSSQSSGIKASVDKIIPLIQFIHTGGSCGYPGGCNNRSPTQADLVFNFTGLPARVYLKLWKNQVNDVSQKEDMDFIIDLN